MTVTADNINRTATFHNLPAIDLSLATKRANNQAELAKELMGMLVNNFTDEKQQLTNAFQQKNWDLLRQYLHKLYGATCYCGVPKLEAFVKELQIQIKAELDKEQINTCFHNVMSAIEEIEIEYNQYKTNYS